MIPAENFRLPYDGNDVADEFAYGFPVTDEDHILVTHIDSDDVETPWGVGVEYTVNGVGSADRADWTITTADPLPSGESIVITPNLPLLQLTNFSNQGGSRPETIEQAVDKLTIIAQQQQEQIDRAVKVTVGSDTDPNDLISDLVAASATATTAAATATTQAGIATAQASAASTSASNAATSETNAAASAAAASGISINAQTGTTYAILSTDKAKVVTLSNGSPVAASLAIASSFTSPFWFWLENKGAGTATITPTTSTINGASTLVLKQNQGCLVVSDGTNYQVVFGFAHNVSLTADVTGVLPVANFTTGTPDGTKFVRDDGVLATPSVPTTLPTGYTSAAQTITAAGALTLAHGLGSKPRLVQLRLKCISAEKNYSVNDEIFFNPMATGDSGGNEGISIVPDATNLNIRYGSQTNVFVIVDKTTGASAVGDLTKWNVIFDAWK